MNNEQKLQAITDLIADKELKEGCFYEYGKGKYVMKYDRMPEYYSCRCRDRTLYGQAFTGYRCGYCKKGFSHPNTGIPRYCRSCAEKHGKCQFCAGRLKILGTPPDLTRVLAWIDKEKIDISISLRYGHVEFHYGDALENAKIVLWDLSEPLLKNQSEEVISFLYDLLITK